MDTESGTQSEEEKLNGFSLVSGNLDLDPQKRLDGYKAQQKYETAYQFVDTCLCFVLFIVNSSLQIFSHVNFYALFFGHQYPVSSRTIEIPQFLTRFHSAVHFSEGIIFY